MPTDNTPKTTTPGPLPARWYIVSCDGIATLCADEADARREAMLCDNAYPRRAPHRAVMLGDAAAERERMRMLIADDASAMTYQTMGQYRSALLKALKA